jgi:putative Mg2+ transporter-C (MgtC) family protein
MESVLVNLGIDVPDGWGVARVAVKLVLAALLGGVLGWERERSGKAAGIRTHMLVCMGSALFVIGSLEAGAPTGDLTRVVQGVATGIGFVGAGAILKLTDQGHIVGLTTAAGIWMTAATGMAVGFGRLWLALISVVLAVLILALLGQYRAGDGPDPGTRSP